MSGYAKRMMQIAAAWLRANPDPRAALQLPKSPRHQAQIADLDRQIARTDRIIARARITEGSAELLQRAEAIRASLLQIQDKAKSDNPLDEAREFANRGYRRFHGKIERPTEGGDDPLWYATEAPWLLAWARDSYNVFDLSPDFCAAMLLTDQRQIDLPSLRLPFRGILFTIPDQFAVGAEGTSYTKVHVADLEDSRPFEDTPESPTIQIASPSQRPAIAVYATDGTHILFTIAPRDELSWDALEDLPDEVDLDADREARKTIQRIVLGALAYATLVDRAIVEHDPGRRKKRPVPPSNQTEIRHWTIGSTIKIEPELVRAARQGAREIGLRIQRRFIVRGHYRDQAHGPGRTLRTARWIAPFYKGPEDGARIVHTYQPSTPEAKDKGAE